MKKQDAVHSVAYELFGITPLMNAASNGSAAAVETLMKAGAAWHAEEHFLEMMRDLLKDASDVKSVVKAFCEDMTKKGAR